jgi:hypothetical protein
MSPGDVMEIIRLAVPGAIGIAIVITCGVLLNTWLKMKHGYPLSGTWGQKLYPKTSSEEAERIKLLSQENAQLRAELGSIKDRMGNVERIVTDSGYSLTHQIEALRSGQTKGEA